EGGAKREPVARRADVRRGSAGLRSASPAGRSLCRASLVSPSDNTIFLTLAGSQAHGTARAGSDVDLRGVCIAPLSVRLSIFRDFEQYEGGLPDALSADVLPRLKEHPTASQALA